MSVSKRIKEMRRSRNVKRLLVIIALALLASLLAGCATASSDCPQIIVYSKEEQNKLSKELEAKVKPGDMIDLFVRDYNRERGMLRECQ